MPLQEKGNIRDLGFISWEDPYAEYEDYDSDFFINGVKNEDLILEKQYDKIPKNIKDKWIKSYSDLPDKHEPYYIFDWNGHSISICESSRLMPSILVAKNNNTLLDIAGMRGFSINNDTLVTIRDLSDGKESMTLDLYNNNIKKILTIDKVGETACVDGQYLYYTEAQDIYWFNTISKIDIKSKKIKHLYKESDKKYVLQVKLPSGQPDIFVIRTNAIYQDVGIIQDDKIKWLVKGFGKKIPLSKNSIAFDSYFTLNKEKIMYPDNWKLIDASIKDQQNTLFIFTKDTFHSLWSFNNNIWQWQCLSTRAVVCDIKFSITDDKIIFGYPNKPDIIKYIDSNNKLIISKEINGHVYTTQHGKEPVPWFSIQSSSKPKAVIICGYGSYGMSMKKTQQRIWLPWLKQNFMIVNLCVRGGGENGDAWWDASRTAKRRQVGIDDFINGVNYIQKRFGFTNKNTAIYGRSAGGFLVNAASFKLLDKITVVYAAKPYTDVLRTTSNLIEPQTEAETEEFGLSYNNPVDFAEIIKISPYENIIETDINPVIILTGGTNDTEVGPYMPLKYARRLRDFGWKNVFCRIAKGEGHFTDKDKEIGEALDAALCEYFMEF